MAFLDGDEYASAGVADLAAGDEFGIDRRTVIGGFHDSGLEGYRAVDGCRTQKFDMKFGRDGTRGMLRAGLFHQVICCSPIRMAIEQCTDDAAIEHARKGLVMRLGVKFRDKLVAFGEASDL